MPYVLRYLVLINLVTLIAYGVDKSLARARKRRISEFSLLFLAAIGGAPSAWLACQLFRHKTIKASFRFQLVVATVVCATLLFVTWKVLEET